MKNTLKEFSELVETYRRLFHCSVCFHDYSGDIFKAAGSSHNIHLNPFCRIVKKNQVCEKKCVEFDSGNVRHFFSCGKKELAKVCHAGVLEFVVPVFSENRLCGAVFLGPFKLSKNSRSTGVTIQGTSSDLPQEAVRILKELPEMDDTRLDDMLNMVRLLSEKLGRIISSVNRDYILGQGYTDKIPYFISREFKNSISIANLAEFLSLSISRTSRLVKIHTGKNFPELLAEKRVEHAKFLLENSFFNMELVSKQCGFAEPAYFFRTFKRLENITPSEYRKRLKGNNQLSV